MEKDSDSKCTWKPEIHNNEPCPFHNGSKVKNNAIKYYGFKYGKKKKYDKELDKYNLSSNVKGLMIEYGLADNIKLLKEQINSCISSANLRTTLDQTYNINQFDKNELKEIIEKLCDGIIFDETEESFSYFTSPELK